MVTSSPVSPKKGFSEVFFFSLYPKEDIETEKHELQLEIVPEGGISFEHFDLVIDVTLRVGFVVTYVQ